VNLIQPPTTTITIVADDESPGLSELRPCASGCRGCRGGHRRRPGGRPRGPLRAPYLARTIH